MTNFDSLKTEIQQHLEANSFTVYHSYSRAISDLTVVEWDAKNYPDYKLFLQTARQMGAPAIVFHHREFSTDAVDHVAERLEMAELPHEEKRNIERRLDEIAAYKGFTCAIELSFDVQGRCYLFELRTPWYEELDDIDDEIDEFLPEDDDEEDEGPIGGYFSRN